MKQYLLLAILIELSKKPFMTAAQLADKFEISRRSVYRYINDLESAGIKTFTKVGKNGGVGIEESFVLESFVLTEREKLLIKQSFDKIKNQPEILSIAKKLNLDKGKPQ